ncbi:xylulokinase [Mycoplasmatota bacterium]|nr:xylulokinase [Mycoplasmatota bacterium]
MYIGIDLGTSSVKLILVNKFGEVIKSVIRDYDLIIPKSSWAEQDPNLWYSQSIDGLKELVSGYENQIEAVSFSGQMHGLVILDENDNVLRPAILWNDQRTLEEVDFLNNEVGVDTLINETGNIALTGLTAPKILWVKKHEPEIFKKISKIMLPKDYLAYKLSGVFATDVSDVSGTLYYDVKNKKYSQQILDIMGVVPSQLPKVYESFEKIGSLKKDIIKNVHFEKDVSVIIGGGDQAVGAVGVGIVEGGKASISLGTSGVIFVASDKFKVDTQSHFQSYCHTNGNYHIMSVMLNAAGALKWWSEKVFNDKNYDLYFKGVNESDINNNLFFLPYLSGERAPINDPKAQGVFLGLDLSHSKKDLDRAVIEGITFALKQSFMKIQDLGIDIPSVRITGGGAKSEIWAQMIADILGVEVYTMENEEGPALGAAILAMVGDGVYKNVQEACQNIVKLGKHYAQNEKNFKIYEKKYKKFVIIYPRVKTLFLSDDE